MSDLLIVRSPKTQSVERALLDWSGTRQWVKSAELHDGWEKSELQINRRNAYKFMRGKHKHELAELVMAICDLGGSVVHVALRGDQRSETELRDWAMRITPPNNQNAPF